MNQKARSMMVLILGLLFCASNACGITSIIGGSSGGVTYQQLETWDTNPGGSASSTQTVYLGGGVTSMQNTQIDGLDYEDTKSARSTSGDYAEVSYKLENAVLGMSSVNDAWATPYSSYAVAGEEWDIQSADSIEFSAYAKNRWPKYYEAKVTTNIVNGGVLFENKAQASKYTAFATQTLTDAWGEKITRVLSANNGFRFRNQKVESYDIEAENPVDYEDTAKATRYIATVTPTGGPVQPTPPSYPPYEWPVSSGPSYPSYQWPVGLGW